MKIKLIKDTRISHLNKNIIQKVDFECEVPDAIGKILVRKERAEEIEEFTANIEVVETTDIQAALKQAREGFEADFKEELEQFNTDKETLKEAYEQLNTDKETLKTDQETLATDRETFKGEIETFNNDQSEFATAKETLATDQDQLKKDQDALAEGQEKLAEAIKKSKTKK